MPPEISQEQNNQLKSWATERDAILQSISVLKDEKNKLEKTNRDLALSNTDIQNQINRSIGRMEELDKKETEYKNITSKELSKTLSEKTNLETEISHLKKQIELLIPQKNLLIEGIKTMTDVHERISKQALALEKIVGNTTKVNSDNINVLNSIISNVKSSLKEVTDINNQNVKSTNNIINELPKLFFELQRKALRLKI